METEKIRSFDVQFFAGEGEGNGPEPGAPNPTPPEKQTEQSKEEKGAQSDEQSKGKGKAALFDEGDKTREDEKKSEDEEKSQEKRDDEKQKDEKPALLTAEDLKIPEGFQYDKEAGDAFLGIVNDAGLSRKELVQKLVDMHAAQMGKMLQGLQAADAEGMKKFEADMAQEKAAWMDQCKADPEYGGAAWEANDAVIDRGCKQLATPEAIALLQRYNLNTHPEIVRMFYRAGKLAGEDKSGGGAGGGGKIDPAEAIFGESLRGVKGLNANG